jgi:N-acetylmuramoyl-L-alanine amidase
MKKVFIDPGHGGEDNGAAWGERYDYLEEDDLNLIISFLLRYELLLTGFETRLSREEDVSISLSERTQMANTWGADLYVSIHADAFHNETARGISTHIHPHCSPTTKLLATWVQSELTKRFPDHINRGIKRSDFHVLRETMMPAVLIECEFISNPSTRRFLKEPANQIGLAGAIGRGINSYVKSLTRR